MVSVLSYALTGAGESLRLTPPARSRICGASPARGTDDPTESER